LVLDITEKIPAHTRRKAAVLKMGIETLVLLVIGICCIFQPTLSVGPSPLPMVLMKSAPFNQNHLVVIATEVSES
jgi:hypothetical protein